MEHKSAPPEIVTSLDRIDALTPDERERLRAVCERYPLRVNEYYLSLIDWDAPDDPIRKIVIPDAAELDEWGRLDASDEAAYTRAPGLEHKYEFTALLLVSDVCGGQCRFCFRKRLFLDDNDEVAPDLTEALEYIRRHPRINNVLLTGGDSLMLPTRHLREIVRTLAAMEHVRIIRLGSKLPAFNPRRITEDPSLLELLGAFSQGGRRLYVMSHFNHPRELTPEALEAVEALQRAGASVTNQTPMLRGVNDDPRVMGQLFNELSFTGAVPYYVFQCRPTLGNRHFTVPIEEAYQRFEQARMRCSGLGKRARFVMSHSTGKVEVVGLSDTQIFLRYHRSADVTRKARFLIFERNPRALWLDDYPEAGDDYLIAHEPSDAAWAARP